MIWPGCNPGGLWRVLVDGEGLEVDSGPLSDLESAAGLGELDGALCAGRPGAGVLIYDGDTGEFVGFLGVLS